MTDKHELIALAERVEALTGPCHETDKAILAALGYTWRGMGYWADDDSHQWRGPTFFTERLDAALTLVPEGWKLRQMNFSGPCADDRKWHLNLRGGSVGQDRFVGRGRTPALALTAAALRSLARERQQ